MLEEREEDRARRFFPPPPPPPPPPPSQQDSLYRRSYISVPLLFSCFVGESRFPFSLAFSSCPPPLEASRSYPFFPLPLLEEKRPTGLHGYLLLSTPSGSLSRRRKKREKSDKGNGGRARGRQRESIEKRRERKE